MDKLIVVNESDHKIFTKTCNELISKGYTVSSSSCGHVDSAEYNFCSNLYAIMINLKAGE